MDVPDIDGLAYIKVKDNTIDRDFIGQYVNAKIVDTKDYDIICEEER